MIRIIRTLGALALAVCAALAHGQSYPVKPVRIVVPFPAGGTTDILAREAAQRLTQSLGQPFVVDNRPGAGGNIGAELVAKAPADGYAFLMGTVGTHAINASLYNKLPYDHVRDFAPVILVAGVPNVLEVNPAVPVNSVQELIAYAKAHPGKLNFAVAGLGSSIHLATEDFKLRTGTTMLAVPYKGTSAALTDLMAGAVDLLFVGSASAMSHVQAGSVKAIGVTSKAPIAQLPNVPPLSATVPGFESSAWFGLMGPSKMDPRLTETLYQAIKACLSHPDMVAKLDAEAAIRVSYTPAEFSQFIRDEMTRLRDLVTRANIKFES